MDIEGYEYNVFLGMKEFFKTNKSCKIFMEIRPMYMNKEETLFILNKLKDNGFRLTKLIRRYSTLQLYYNKDVFYHYDLDELINDEDIITGEKGAFECFFERK